MFFANLAGPISAATWWLSTSFGLMKIPALAQDTLIAWMTWAALRGWGAIGAVQASEPGGAVGEALDDDVGHTFLRTL